MKRRPSLPPVALVFDGDDTLWGTEQLYDDARSEARAIVEAAGFDGRTWEAIERQFDIANVATLGYSPARFPRSCVEAYVELCKRAGKKADSSVAEQVRRAAKTVFEREPAAMAGARETLEFARQRGIRLALLTKGDMDVQSRRIETSGLGSFFDVIRIVPEKSAAAIRSVVTALGANAEQTWMVGNSIKSDITPAIEAGLTAIWIDAHVWEYERAPQQLLDERAIALSTLTEIPKLIGA